MTDTLMIGIDENDMIIIGYPVYQGDDSHIQPLIVFNNFDSLKYFAMRLNDYIRLHTSTVTPLPGYIIKAFGGV